MFIRSFLPSDIQLRERLDANKMIFFFISTMRWDENTLPVNLFCPWMLGQDKARTDFFSFDMQKG